jgi:hypothetical protein
MDRESLPTLRERMFSQVVEDRDSGVVLLCATGPKVVSVLVHCGDC